jgi:hypothetical protein
MHIKKILDTKRALSTIMLSGGDMRYKSPHVTHVAVFICACMSQDSQA